MEKRDLWYKADNGKHFVVTEKGKNECIRYKDKKVGEIADYDNETYGIGWAVDFGYIEEVPIPEWTKLIGYKVMYMNGKYEISAGNGNEIFPTREIANRYKEHCESYPWWEHECYIKTVEYEGKPLNPCRKYNGKTVFNSDYCFISSLRIGDYVEKEVVDNLINSVSPACMSDSCSQCGEAVSHEYDENTGKTRATYCTFKKVDKDVWEYCGNCFRGENKERRNIIHM